MKRFKRPATGHKSYESALNGIMKYIQTNKPLLIPKVEVNKQFTLLNGLLIVFLKEKELTFRNTNSTANMYFNANLVQDNFKLFKHWLKQYKL